MNENKIKSASGKWFCLPQKKPELFFPWNFFPFLLIYLFYFLCDLPRSLWHSSLLAIFSTNEMTPRVSLLLPRLRNTCTRPMTLEAEKKRTNTYTGYTHWVFETRLDTSEALMDSLSHVLSEKARMRGVFLSFFFFLVSSLCLRFHFLFLLLSFPLVAYF